MLPENIKSRAEEYARNAHISLAEVIRISLEEKLNKKTSDAFFSDTEYFRGKTPADLSINHDKYLYD